jgi:hypothetical protein
MAKIFGWSDHEVQLFPTLAEDVVRRPTFVTVEAVDGQRRLAFTEQRIGRKIPQ